ncbi:uncharacterized protein [Dermacentor albipictus]|uniref:uncharacterized protein isoform X2 n=1 Tax=Dermacentor albipictus TaxID=60249 RepID=UPI0038FC260B
MDASDTSPDDRRAGSSSRATGRRRFPLLPLRRDALPPARSRCDRPPTKQAEERTADAASGTCSTAAPTATGSGKATPATSSTGNLRDPTAAAAAAAAAESQTESITYELASRPDPGLFARFFGEKGYQRGRRATHDDQAAASGSRDPASPTRGTWASDADWRAQISNLATHEKKSRKSAKLMLAQQALNRLRHWTSGHHHHHHHAMTTDPNGGSPVRQDLMDDAKSAEEAKTLLRRPRVEDCPEAYSEDMSTVAGGGVGCVAGAKTSSSAGDLLLGLGPTHFKAISRRVQSSTAVAVKAQDAGYARASGDFCCPTAANGVFAPEVRALSAASSEETWSTTTTTSKKGGHHFASSQRSIDGFFKRLVRKK